ncbi:ras and EF-hand domain-containing protein homolog isoform X2 [Centruroides vittatus]|uniref:ras and EF-hand domain-containing protein homolog isoform X2 n=1 Tax=Centruroides vittatus TaxID=120091 RepID=UPI0035109DC3
MAENQLEKLFKECDVQGTGYLCQEGMRELCARVSVCVQDADAIFQTLDTDGDGKITFNDISTGLLEFLNQNSNSQKDGCKTPDSETDFVHDKHQLVLQAWQHFATEVGKSDKIISEENILELYKELQKSNKPHLISQFETVMADLMENVNRLQEEKHRLEHFWKRERKEQELYLHKMEEEMTNQVKDLELKVKREAQEEVETERKNLKIKMDAEMDELQAHLSLFEKVNSWLQSCGQHHFQDEKANEIRNKLEEALHENHQLRMNLIDTQTNVALMRSEMAQLRNQYEEKCRELNSEKERIMEVLHEHTVLGRQIHYLQYAKFSDYTPDANRKLNDTNDTLREAMQKSPVDNFSRIFPRSEHRGSIIGDYLYNDILSERRKRTCSEDVEFEDHPELNVTERTKDDLDSGFSTLRDFSEEQEEGINHNSMIINQLQHSPLTRTETLPTSEKIVHCDVRRIKSLTDNESSLSSPSSECKSEEKFPRRKIADIKRQLGLDPNKAGRPRSLTPSPVPLPRSTLQTTNKKLRSSSMSLYNKKETEEEVDKTSMQKVADGITDSEIKNTYEATGPPERTYKIVFIGDAAVGKSSFILRLSKGMFVAHLNSTLGVDFQVKTLKIDDKNIALQLWDTAGQERFRSITQSYFRKTDGVMLLYDCTNESSFLNVRQWMEAIDVSCFYRMMAKQTSDSRVDATTQKIPVMIVANKTDLRDLHLLQGNECVPYESGEKLAKDFGAMFMEASAKSGSNVFEAIAELARSMAINEDLQVKSSGSILLKEGNKKSGKCCKK